MVNRVDKLRAEYGDIHPGAKTKVKNFLESPVQSYIKSAPFAVLSTSNSEGDCDASPRGGLPGFIKVLDANTLLIPDNGGNRLFQSYQNVESNPKAGLMFMIPGIDVTVRVNGRVRFVELEELSELKIKPEVLNADENSMVVQGLMLSVDEAYFHCPRAFMFAELWNTTQIIENAQRSFKEIISGKS
jgi:PPOX class probable FMN-dependent enzyme